MVRCQMFQVRRAGSDVKCFKCGEPGHISPHCPKADEDDAKSQAKSVKKLEKDLKSIKID